MLTELGETGCVLSLIEQFRGHVFSCFEIEMVLCESFVETPSRWTIMRVTHFRPLPPFSARLVVLTFSPSPASASEVGKMLLSLSLHGPARFASSARRIPLVFPGPDRPGISRVRKSRIYRHSSERRSRHPSQGRFHTWRKIHRLMSHAL